MINTLLTNSIRVYRNESKMYKRDVKRVVKLSLPWRPIGCQSLYMTSNEPYVSRCNCLSSSFPRNTTFFKSTMFPLPRLVCRTYFFLACHSLTVYGFYLFMIFFVILISVTLQFARISILCIRMLISKDVSAIKLTNSEAIRGSV